MILRKIDFSKFSVSVQEDATDLTEEVCVDLHVGTSFMEAGTSSSYPLNPSYTLRPGACIVVQTKEKITLPKNVFGTLCAKGSLAALGFLVPNTKVDPLFSGHLDIALFNAGSRSLKVESGMAFCSLIFHTLQGPVSRSSPRGGIKVIELKQQSSHPRLVAVGKHVDKWKAIYGLAALVLGIVVTVLKSLKILP
ncbi:MAG: hypothetical protein EOP06_15380 [Proteobacteria bacterium]|nr:MAG: hypothetical protein EOP06_15380 [Pseudomonadota bacterium]